MGERCPAWCLLIPSSSSWGINSQCQLDAALAFQDLWNTNTVLFASWPLTQNICSSVNGKERLQFSNIIYPCFILSGKGGHTLMSPWHSMAVVVTFENSWLLSSALDPASCLARWSLHGWGTSAGENFGQNFWGEKKKGSSSALEPWVPVPDDPAESAVSTFVPCHRRAAGDAALASIKEQKAFQCSCHEPWAMSIRFSVLKESSGKAKDFDPAPFRKKTLENCWLL